MKINTNNLSRKVYSLKDFRGVDYASSPMEVKPYRATDMANLLLRDGMLHKRHGFEQIYEPIVTVDKNSTFEEQYDVRVFLWGHKEYVVQCLDKINRRSTFAYFRDTLKIGDDFIAEGANKLGSAVVVGEDMYIFCGKYIKLTKNGFGMDAQVVTESNAYIPTTTINVPIISVIAHSDEGNSQNTYYTFEGDSNVKYPTQSNESINMLTGMRKNRLSVRRDFAYDDMPSRQKRYFVLDGILDYSVEDSNYWEQKPWRKPCIIVEDIKIEFNGAVNGGDIFDTPHSIWLLEKYGLAICHRTDFLPEGILDPRVGEKTCVLVVYDDEKFKQLFIDYPVDVDSNGYVHFDVQYFDIKAGDNANKITSCSVATTFGVGGAEDRIFVAGSDEQPNVVYISANDISLNPNPTYFPADQFIACGSGNSAVNGFMKITDGTMAIFKDVQSVEDVAVFYTSGTYNTVGTGEEGNTYQRAVFNVKAGDIKRTGVSAKGISNFEGDNIFVANDGVYGIQLSSNVASGERYARERSRLINPKIRGKELSKAKTIVYKDRFYLAVSGGEVYVADARYRFTLSGDQQDTYNYEWFRLTGLRVKEWFVYNDKLRFIDTDGYMCEFTDEYADQYKVSTYDGELVVKDGCVVFNDKRLDLVKSAWYAVDDSKRTWSIELTKDAEGNNAIKIPEDITIQAESYLTLSFYVPIHAYWQSAVLDLENPMTKKNMWSLSVTASAEHGGMINLGYKTRLNAVNNIQVEGANASTFADGVLFLSGGDKGFGMQTFDTGGYVGINAYRRRVFERNFVFLQLLFESDTVSDCVVNEIDVEYAIGRKNIGVG